MAAPQVHDYREKRYVWSCPEGGMKSRVKDTRAKLCGVANTVEVRQGEMMV